MISIDDRFTFDDLFRVLLEEDFTHEEAKDYIMCNFSLGPIVVQERIENKAYKKITDEMSEDLFELLYEALLKFYSYN